MQIAGINIPIQVVKELTESNIINTSSIPTNSGKKNNNANITNRTNYATIRPIDATPKSFFSTMEF